MTKRFLGIGLNNYLDNSCPLNGCKPDIDLALRIAKEVFKFDSIKTLIDSEATKKEIIANLKLVFRDLKKDDIVYVHYSGHGTSVECVPETAAYEPDGRDECWVCYDHDWDAPLRDDILNHLIMDANPEAKILIVSDSCFSGSMLRMNGDNPRKWRNRFLPPPAGLLKGGPDEDGFYFSRCSLDRSKRLKPFLIDTSTQANAILISGCSDKQTSADVMIPDIGYHGALTWTLFKVLRNHKWNMNYESLVIEVNRELKNAEYEQEPQLEARRNLMHDLFLGGTK